MMRIQAPFQALAPSQTTPQRPPTNAPQFNGQLRSMRPPLLTPQTPVYQYTPNCAGQAHSPAQTASHPVQAYQPIQGYHQPIIQEGQPVQGYVPMSHYSHYQMQAAAQQAQHHQHPQPNPIIYGHPNQQSSTQSYLMLGYTPTNSELPIKFITGYCPSKKVYSIGVRREENLYYYYYYNNEDGDFEPLECLECQPMIFEEHLFPLYAVWCEEYQEHIIFVNNFITLSIEQYVYRQSPGCFEQVFNPDIPYDSKNHSRTEVICIVGSMEKGDHTLIQRNEHGLFKKLRFIEERGCYIQMKSVYVRTLSMEFLEEEQSPPDPLNHSHMYGIQLCPHTRENVVGIAAKNAFIRFTFNDRTGRFEELNCLNCKGQATENALHPQYAVYHDPAKTHVIFAWNPFNWRVEQFIFNRKTRGFEQVFYKDLVFIQSFKTSDTLFIDSDIENDQVVMIHRDIMGGLKKTQLHRGTQQYSELPPVPVKVLPFAGTMDDGYSSVSVSVSGSSSSVSTGPTQSDVTIQAASQTPATKQEAPKTSGKVVAVIELKMVPLKAPATNQQAPANTNASEKPAPKAPANNVAQKDTAQVAAQQNPAKQEAPKTLTNPAAPQKSVPVAAQKPPATKQKAPQTSTKKDTDKRATFAEILQQASSASANNSTQSGVSNDNLIADAIGTLSIVREGQQKEAAWQTPKQSKSKKRK